MRIVFCGTGEIGVPSLRALVASRKYEVAGVITQPDRAAGRDLKLRPSPVKQAATDLVLPVAQPERIRSDFSALAGWSPDVMVVAAYGQILPKAVLDLPRLGCLNVHASLLPRHRGASCIQAAILSGDARTGVTIMFMDEGLDTGDILLASEVEIGEADTAGTLHDRLAKLAPQTLLESLEMLAKGSAPRRKQEESLATYAPKLKKTDGLLDWRDGAIALARRVRAMTPWPGASAKLGDNVLKIHAARPATESGSPGCILRADGGGILVAAGQGSLLLEEVQMEGRKRLPARQFLQGHPLAVGRTFDLSFSAPL